MANEHAIILGTGQMAVMCARLLDDNGHRVTLVGRPDTIATLRQTRVSKQLPDIPLSDRWMLSDDIGVVGQMNDAIVVYAVPTQTLRQVAASLDGCALPGVVCCKGVECDTGRRPTEILKEAGGGSGPLAVLSGPNIAKEVVDRQPTGTVVACEWDDHANRVRDLFATDYFRVYTTPDTLGVELAGAIKNVIAIAAGVVDGLQLGTNAKASLVTRGLVEMSRLGRHCGARPETFSGLAGMGDLMTTCFSPDGRNRRLGELIGRGRTLEAALKEVGATCEGVSTTRALLGLAETSKVEMPIAKAVAAVLFEGVDMRRALTELMSREPKCEVVAGG